MILSSGCSFIWGDELADKQHSGPGGFSNATWPALLAKSIGADYYCVAQPGGSNDAIARNVIAFCETVAKPDLVIVQWTFPWRFGFKFGYPVGSRGDQWYTVDLWTVSDEHKPVDKIIDENDQLFKYSEKIRKLATTVGVGEFADIFFKHIAFTEYWPIYTSLREVVNLQNYLKVNDIPYLFSCADTSLFNNATVQENDVYVNSLLSQLNFDEWLLFPAGTKGHETKTDRGFYQWADENKYPKGPGTHPLETAHQDAASLFKEKFNEMVKKHLEQNSSGDQVSQKD